MNVLSRYFLWFIALFFAMMPLALPITKGPHQWKAALDLNNYKGSVSDLILLCITICVISMIDVMEVFALSTKKNYTPKRYATGVAVLFLGFIVANLFCYCYWYAYLKTTPSISHEETLLTVPYIIVSCLLLSLGCRTVYLIAEK
jgi:hypothetical protein